jgi:polysaccharide pyruvyl transferase WcaK-like protein
VNIVIVHGYSDSNKGDLAIVVATVAALKVLAPNAVITLQTVFSTEDPEYLDHHRFVSQLGIGVIPMAIPSPYVDNQRHSIGRNLSAMSNLVGSYLRQNILRWVPMLSGSFAQQAKALQSIRDADIVLLKGGQYIYNDQGGVRGFLYLWRILNIIDVARSLGKRVVMAGQSVGPLNGGIGRAMARRALGKCASLIVREQLSADLMERLGLAHRTIIAPDFAFLTNKRAPDGGCSSMERLQRGRWLGVTVVNWSYPGYEDVGLKRQQYEQALVEATASVAKERGLGIALFPQVTVRHHGESDLDVLVRIRDRLAAAGVETHMVTEDLWPDEFSYLYGCCELLVGTRLHSCILAACAGVPVLAVRYQGYKTEGVMAGLGMGSYVKDIANLNGNELVEAMHELLDRRSEISEKINRVVEEYRAQLMAVLARELEQAQPQ